MISEAAAVLAERRQRQQPRGRALAWMAFSTLGIVYGDLGTSPIYALQGIFAADRGAPAPADVVGAISAIVWSLTIVAAIKYAIISLEFGSSEGEGGCFSLFTTLYAPAPNDDEAATIFDRSDMHGLAVFRTRTRDDVEVEERIPPAMQKLRVLARSGVKWSLLILSLLGTSLTIADGLLTPAVSVTSAVEGLAIVSKLRVGSDTMPIAIALLVVIFASQQFGTAKISLVFAPIVAIWLTLLAATGIASITYAPGIWRAWNPAEAVNWFRRGTFWQLGGVMLAITGCEAMYAGVGHFAPSAMRIAFLGFAYPCLLLQYLGQGAQLLAHGDEVIETIFYSSLRWHGEWVYWLGFIMSILATIVASQALITATFSLLQQLIAFRCAPPLRIRGTSNVHQGQVYVPAANWAMCIACVAITGGFRTSERLAHAYVLSTAGVMLVTTLLISISIHAVKRLPWILALAHLAFFGGIDGLFFAASTDHFLTGAYITVAIALALCAFMTIWFWTRNIEASFDADNRADLSAILSPEPVDGSKTRTGLYGGRRTSAAVSRTHSLGPYSLAMSRSPSLTPSIMSPPLAYGRDRPTARTSLEKTAESSPTLSPVSSRVLQPTTTSFETTGPLHRVDSRMSIIVMQPPALEPVNEKSLEPIEMTASTSAEDGGTDEDEIAQINGPLYLIDHPHGLKLERIPCFAVFHHPSTARGAPPTFQAFIARWPALPRVCCFMTVRVLAVPTVEPEHRWLISKWRAFNGFYECTMRVGFRDLPDMRDVHHSLGQRLIAMESRPGDDQAASRIQAIVESARAASIHVFPRYILIAKPSTYGRFSLGAVRHFVRSTVLGVMQTLSSIFPETDTLIVNEDQVLRVGVAARV